VVTAGPEGARCFEAGGSRTRVCGQPLDSWLVDTVGAGDAFTAVLVLGTRQGWPPSLALTRAERFARAICRIEGAIPEDPHFYDPYVVEWGLEGWDEDARPGRPHFRARR
jgi:fructokinase